MTEVIDGNAVAEDVRESLRGAIETLTDAGHQPGLATVLMSEDRASATYVSMKQRDCEELGIQSFHVEVDVDAPANELYDTVSDLNANDEVDGILVQHPVADHVDYEEVVRRIDPGKDVDGFHPENVGRLVRGDPRFRPCTPHGVQKLLEHTGVETEGADAVVVGRSNIVGTPLANLLARKADDGNATVTLCHSRTEDLAAKTKQADIVVAAAGVPELVDGSMLSEGVTVVDVGYNRVDGEAVGDVEYESAKEVASAITPVPGGVGPMTRAMLLYNTVKAASQRSGIDVDLP
ncbi:bifunctional 5,10-methylene-tetrahydrofolate dehydrogenase/5,10-methylene-tetrahydrofolate cyclohydrolase [Salinirubellus salinus]|jgi:methylenetetrahydrofolate dehydrogenase (NADP+)/methenyltetrahydrofolate cyclohydrolase|uniref:Bifunctional protein FolD n=1 Tax=Salinirubellus salinus TaxID=1364945 RepID=A0A9E7R588_9EURY|nr:tetrahydrofolate dehydrogenase/cyclohydrolase catalytic domain-containing protein [Salinirubellus salinus]UWM56121.1 bifunctional 5,10-methylene-tetrahydrofolate dehydrogenase/5,10-methylene-tetrahydrofolate cyclohydrolase [Salinirubellus salinus]